jgi:nucleotide-binding universal stress UspA family protein
VNILSMLARLEYALGRNDLSKQMVLRSPARTAMVQPSSEINLVVGYNGSPRSQTALDLTLWIAHQTRLATSKPVTVQVVYVSNWENECQSIQAATQQILRRSNRKLDYALSDAFLTEGRSPTALAEPPAVMAQSCQLEQFDHADRILWQARNLAEEWRGSLKTHLRFGQIATELRDVVEAESAAVLVLGCNSADSAIVQQLGSDFPCLVLGIPHL